MNALVYVSGNETYTHEIKKLEIPKSFVKSNTIREALYATIYGFESYEQKLILLRYWIGFSVEEIAELTKKSPIHIMCLLFLHLERLAFKLNTFMCKTDYVQEDTVSIEELFEAELWEEYKKFLEKYEKRPQYKIKVERMKEAFFESYLYIADTL